MSSSISPIPPFRGDASPWPASPRSAPWPSPRPPWPTTRPSWSPLPSPSPPRRRAGPRGRVRRPWSRARRRSSQPAPVGRPRRRSPRRRRRRRSTTTTVADQPPIVVDEDGDDARGAEVCAAKDLRSRQASPTAASDRAAKVRTTAAPAHALADHGAQAGARGPTAAKPTARRPRSPRPGQARPSFTATSHRLSSAIDRAAEIRRAWTPASAAAGPDPSLGRRMSGGGPTGRPAAGRRPVPAIRPTAPPVGPCALPAVSSREPCGSALDRHSVTGINQGPASQGDDMYTEMALTARRFALTLAVAGIAAMGSVALAPAASAAAVRRTAPAPSSRTDNGNGPDQFIVAGARPRRPCSSATRGQADTSTQNDVHRRCDAAPRASDGRLRAPDRSTARLHTGSDPPAVLPDPRERRRRASGGAVSPRGRPGTRRTSPGSRPARRPGRSRRRCRSRRTAGRRCRRSSSAHRSASPNSPSPRESSQPTGPGVAPAVHALELGDHGRGVRGRGAADGRRRVHRADQLQQPGPARATRCAAGVPRDVAGQVAHVGQGQQVGLLRRGRGSRSTARSARTSESTASACSARSFAEPMQLRGQPLVVGARAARARCRPARAPTAAGRLRRSSSSGVAPSRPSTANVQQSGKRSASRRSSRRGSSGTSAETSRSRARTTLASSPAPIRPTAVATAAHHDGRVEGAVGVPQPGRRAVGRVLRRRAGASSRGSTSPTVVTQPTPSRRPTTTSGTTKTDVPAAGSKAMLANRTGPEPGTPTVVVDVERRRSTPTHQAAASASASRAGDLQPGGLAPADQALAVAHPGQRALGRQAVEQRAGVRRSRTVVTVRASCVRARSGRPQSPPQRRRLCSAAAGEARSVGAVGDRREDAHSAGARGPGWTSVPTRSRRCSTRSRAGTT